MMEPRDRELFLAKLALQEALPSDVDAFVAWAFAHNPAGPRLQQLAGYRPITDDLDPAFLGPAVHEAGLELPTPLDALLCLARDQMRRLVAEEISPEEGAGNIDNFVYGSGVPHEVVSRIPELWNFCVYRRYLRGAGDVGSDTWYAEVVSDIVAEAEFHLGLREQPPPDSGAPTVEASATQPIAAAQALRAHATVEREERQDEANLAPSLGGRDRTANESFTLGLAYATGNGVPRDMGRAASLYRKAADLGHVAALNNLGYLYDRGEGVPEDRAKALECWFAAAERGDERAQCSIGYAYEIGKGVPIDSQLALSWYRRSAENHCAAAHANLGNIYMAGEWVQRDVERAVFHYRRGADLGEARAQYQLATLYQRGEGVPRDFERAAELFRRAYETLNRQRS